MHKSSALALVAAVTAAAACAPDEDYKKQAPPPEPSAATPPAVKPMPVKKKVIAPEEMGSCTLTAAGAVKKEQTTPGGREATNVSYWLKDEERKAMMGVDGFAISCRGPDIKFQLVPSGKPDGMPFAPKKYDFGKAGKGDAAVTVGFAKGALEKINGSVDITAFDKHHVAGKVDLRGQLNPGGGEVTITGSFDLVCPNLSNCE